MTSLRTQSLFVSLLVGIGFFVAPVFPTYALTTEQLIIAPDATTIDVGETASFTATHDPNGCFGEVGCTGLKNVTQSAQWLVAGFTSSERERIALIAPGRYKGVSGGTGLVQAKFSGLSDLASIRVNSDEQSFAHLHITGAATVSLGNEVSLTATHDPNGCFFIGGCVGLSDVTKTAVWSVVHASVLQNLGQGTFRALSPGTTLVRAASDGEGAEIEITVTPAEPPTNGPSGEPETYDVVYEKKLLESSGTFFADNHSTTIGLTKWLPNGHFVVSAANCNIHSNLFGSWVFTESGQLVGERHQCQDSLISGDRAEDLFLEAHSWGFSPILEIVGDAGFARLGASSAFAYPPIFYSVSGGRVRLGGKPYSLTTQEGNDNPPRSYTAHLGEGPPAPLIEYAAATQNKLVVSSITNLGKIDGEFKNIIYSLPDFSVLGEERRVIAPITGVGDFIISWPVIDRNVFDRGKTVVHRIINNTLQFVQTLDYRATFVSKDPAGNRIALGSSDRIFVYDVTDKGLVLSETRNYPAGFAPPPGIGTPPNPFAIAGKYFAIGLCKGGDGCSLEVWRGNTRLSVQPLADISAVSRGRREVKKMGTIRSIAISRSGKLAVSSVNGVQLYRIKDFAQNTPSVGALSLPTVSIPPQPFTFGTSNPFIERIQRLLNQDPETRVSSFGAGSVGEETSFFGARTLDAIQRFQVKHGIVREGEAGYGIIGPRTRAQLNNLSTPSTQGEDTVRSPHITPRIAPSETPPSLPPLPPPTAAPSQTTQPTPTPEEGEEEGVMQTRLNELQDRLRDTLRQLQDLRDQLGL